MRAKDDPAPGDHVVLLHGLGRSSASLLYAAGRLRRAGFATVNLGYASRRLPLEVLARSVAERLPPAASRLHFFTHSMGGIVLRCLVKAQRPANLGRVVMLGPPNRGSQLATRLRGAWYYRMLMGPAGQQIGADLDSVPNTLGPVDFELGVIAGNRALDPFRFLVAGENDGKVSLEETRVEGMSDWLCIPRGHALLMFDRQAIDQAAHFFRHGRFARTGGSFPALPRSRP
jgi:pimeloyl-ACP methyl ester carboxylesterase